MQKEALRVVQITEKDFNTIKKELGRAYSGLVEYAETLEDTGVCSEHLDKIDNILNKYQVGNEEE